MRNNGPYKRKGSKNYWITFRNNGKKVYESTGTANKKLADRIYARRKLDVAEGKWFAAKIKPRTFGELKEKYMREHSKVHKAPKSNIRDISSFNHLDGFFGDCLLSEITPGRIAEYKSFRLAEGIRPATLARELEVLRHALNLAVREWEWLEKSPFEKVRIEKINNKSERWITKSEEHTLLDASQQWLREIIIFALNTGMRQNEILSLKWSEVDLSRRTVTVLETKNKEKRTIPINQTVFDLLRQKSRVKSISGYLFVSEAATKIDARNLLRAYYSARKTAKLEGVRFHDLRHTFATRLVQRGVDLYTVKELMGHKTITMTMRYAHHNPESLRHGVEVLDRATQDLAPKWLQFGYSH